uniref:Defensin-like protein n=1 Tax=Tamarix hispida TaxID=189793 RepID=A0A4P8F8W3_9CARY|nr:defensin-like protein [Tamarix hispida]
MAKPRTMINTFAICLIFILLANQEIMTPVEGKTCYSTSWNGICYNSAACSRECRKYDKARKGECRFDGKGRACFCIY